MAAKAQRRPSDNYVDKNQNNIVGLGFQMVPVQSMTESQTESGKTGTHYKVSTASSELGVAEIPFYPAMSSPQRSARESSEEDFAHMSEAQYQLRLEREFRL